MKLITISKPLSSFPGFRLPARLLQYRQKSIEVAVRPGKGSAAVCSRCHLPGARLRPTRRTAFYFHSPVVLLLYTMRRVDCRRCGVIAVRISSQGDGKGTLTKAYMFFPSLLGKATTWKETVVKGLKQRKKIGVGLGSDSLEGPRFWPLHGLRRTAVLRRTRTESG
jgi:hypothetical protein